MTNKEIQEKVKELTDKINQYQKELDDIRKNCKHEEYKIDLYHSDKDSTIPVLRRICKYCDGIVGFPNKEEYEKWELNE